MLKEEEIDEEEEEEVETYTKEKKGEWDFLADEGVKEVLKTHGRHIYLCDELLNRDKKDYEDLIKKYPDDIPYMPTTQKITPVLNAIDGFFNALIGERRYIKQILEEKNNENIKMKKILAIVRCDKHENKEIKTSECCLMGEILKLKDVQNEYLRRQRELAELKDKSLKVLKKLKLTEGEKEKIIELYETKESIKNIAKKLNRSRNTIS